MPPSHRIVAREMGKIRLHLTPQDRAAATGVRGRFTARPVYRALINAAKQDGPRSAAAHATHYRFGNGGRVKAAAAVTANARLTLCVELIDTKGRLEEFCRRHGDLLAGKDPRLPARRTLDAARRRERRGGRRARQGDRRRQAVAAEKKLNQPAPV